MKRIFIMALFVACTISAHAADTMETCVMLGLIENAKAADGSPSQMCQLISYRLHGPYLIPDTAPYREFPLEGSKEAPTTQAVPLTFTGELRNGYPVLGNRMYRKLYVVKPYTLPISKQKVWHLVPTQASIASTTTVNVMGLQDELVTLGITAYNPSNTSGTQ